MPRTRDGNFRSVLLPSRRKYTEDVGDVIKALFIAGVSQGKLTRVLEILIERGYRDPVYKNDLNNVSRF